MDSFIFFIFFSVFTTVFASFANSPYWRNERNKDDELVSIRGKTFHKNGGSLVSSLAATEAQIYQQCLDHNDKSCSVKWSQRYFVSTVNYIDNGPVFFMLGAESPADGFVEGGQWSVYAKFYGAVMVILEHRFYGESIPKTNTTIEDLQLLMSSRQALADGARFIEDFKTNNNYTGAKTVVFGGSYGGNLAAWFRQKYPKSANLAVSSSGPLQAQFDFPEYMRTVSEVIYWEDSKCYFEIKNAFDCVEQLVRGETCSSSTHNESDFMTGLQQCWNPDFDNEASKDNFFQWMACTEWETNEPLTEIINQGKCSALDNQTSADPIDNYGGFLKVEGESQTCAMESKPTSSNRERDQLAFINTKEGVRSGAAGWFWQTCNEFGYYMTADQKYQVFGTQFSTLSYVNLCQKQFGPMFTSEYIQGRINQTNEHYKGKQNDGTCIIFVNGQYDPWHPLGINSQSETSLKNSVISIPKAEHCEDMTAFPDNKPDTTAAQLKIQTLIGQYLNDPNCV